MGFSALGPTVGLGGTLLGENDGQFVTHMRAKVIRVKDRSQHEFDWRIARTEILESDGTNKVTGVIASAFVLEQEATFPYSVLMVEPSADSDFARIRDQLQKDWQAYVVAQLGGVPNLADPAVLEKLQKNAEAMYQEFSKPPEYANSSAALERLFYWNAGSYELKLLVDVRRRGRPL